jgi:hypothetical protein
MRSEGLKKVTKRGRSVKQRCSRALASKNALFEIPDGRGAGALAGGSWFHCVEAGVELTSARGTPSPLRL